MANGVQIRALRLGVRLMGGEARLRDMLDAPPGAFLRWLEGAEAMPAPVFVMLLEFLADMESETLLPR